MISGNLEYLMSSLPELSLPATPARRRQVETLLRKYAAVEEGATVELAEILDAEAAKFLSHRALALLRAITLDRIYLPLYQTSKCRLLADYSRYEAQLRQEIAELRKQRRQAPTDQASPAWLTPGNPLEETAQIQALRWQQIDALSSGHYADFDALVAYKLKLLILQRQWSFDAEKGLQIFRQLTKAQPYAG